VTDVFVARDHSIAILITIAIRKALAQYCTQAGRHETGGILIGHYTPLGDQAVITKVTSAPRDSSAGRSWFVRGVAGLQQLINRAWRRRDYYLGEWHFHPFASPDPSDRDRRQIAYLSRDPDYRCPEPILIVVGGDPGTGGDLAVSVVLKGKLEELHEWDPRSSGAARPRQPRRDKPQSASKQSAGGAH
jgi:integrative and conjugative element protein (TIGR02256 family)